MPAVAVIAAVTGAATAVGAAAATAIGLGTVGTIAATAIGSGIIAGGTTAIMGGDVSDVLESAVVGGLTSYVGGSVASSVGDVVTQTTGSEILGKAAGNVAASAVTGGDEEAILRSGLLGGLSQSLKGGGSNLNDVYELGSTDVNADYSLANGTQMHQLTDMGGAQGLQAGTSANLADMGGAQGFTFNVGAPVTTIAEAVDAINTMNGTFNAANLDSMGGGQGLTYQTPTGLVTEDNTLLVGGDTGNTSVIGETGVDTAYNIGDGIGDTLADIDTGVYDSSDGLLSSVVTNVNGTDSVSGLTASDVINLINTGLVIADGTDSTDTVTDGNQYPIIPIPTDWTSPPPTSVAPFTPLTPIDFGDRNLLINTQWEKLLDPNYGKVPEPVVYSQPSNLSYNDLMAILGSKQGMPPASSLSINDIISGIQNQYGQANRSSMG